MHSNSRNNALAGLIVLLCASSARAGGLTSLDAVQFSGAASTAVNQIATGTTCTGSGFNFSCTSVIGTVQIGMIVVHTSGSGTVLPQTIVSAVSGTSFTVTTSVNLSNDTVEFIGQQINDQLGTSFYISPPLYYANNWELSEGTASAGASFTGPMLKISKYENITSPGSPGQCDTQIDAECNSVLYIGVNSNVTNAMESQGMKIAMVGNAPNANCVGGNCNISGFQQDIRTNPPNTTIVSPGCSYNSTTGATSCALHTWGSTITAGDQYTLSGLTGTNSYAALDGTWTAAASAPQTFAFTGPTGLTLTVTGGNLLVQGMSPSGGLWAIKDNGSGIVSGMKGLEMDLNNNTGIDCPAHNGTSYGMCNGIILVSKGSNAVGAALHVRGVSPATFIDGLEFDQACCTNADINDWSSATNAIYIQGSHTVAVNIASAAGPVVLNDNYLWPGAKATGAPYVAADLAPNTLSIFAGNGSTAQEILRATYTGAIVENGGLEVGAATGGLEGAGTVNASGVYYSNGTAGVTCSGSPTNSFASSKGIVTHC